MRCGSRGKGREERSIIRKRFFLYLASFSASFAFFATRERCGRNRDFSNWGRHNLTYKTAGLGSRTRRGQGKKCRNNKTGPGERANYFTMLIVLHLRAATRYANTRTSPVRRYGRNRIRVPGVGLGLGNRAPVLFFFLFWRTLFFSCVVLLFRSSYSVVQMSGQLW